MSELRKREASAKNFSIMEDLGMLTHVFSDKTGTLTENEMKFKSALVGKKIYGSCAKPKLLQRRNTVPSK